MGDVIHTVPALSDANKALPGIRFDWVVEEAFAEIPAWSQHVDRVISVAMRRWRNDWVGAWRSGEIKSFLQRLRERQYDYVIDAQGLAKSALLTRLARGMRCGFDKHSAREAMASLGYKKRVSVACDQHAIIRTRKLFADILGYDYPGHALDYGIAKQNFSSFIDAKPYVVFLHGTTWPTKHWPEKYWCELAGRANASDLQVVLPWGNEAEKKRAELIAQSCEQALVLPDRLKLGKMAGLLAYANGIVAVDTGLGHLAAALDVPVVSLYGPTNPDLTGALGDQSIHLKANFGCAPCLQRQCTYQEETEVDPACFGQLPPGFVWGHCKKHFNVEINNENHIA